jgi:hypothetical protein
MRGRRAQRAAPGPRTIRRNGASFFAEHPARDATEARLLWHADLDPGTLSVVAIPSVAGDPDAIDPAALAPWLTLVAGRSGEHAVLSDGRRHIRIDIEHGTLAGGAVRLRYQLEGLATAQPKILPLRRLIDLSRHRRFLATLYPPDRRVDRWLAALRVHDALRAGTSQREITRVLFGGVGDGDERRADSLLSRVRRLAREARALGRGGYRQLMLRQIGSARD